MENMNSIKEKINELREILYSKIEGVKDLKDEKVIELSRQLDYLIAEYIMAERLCGIAGDVNKL